MKRWAFFLMALCVAAVVLGGCTRRSARTSGGENGELMLVNSNHPVSEDWEPTLSMVQGEYRMDALAAEPMKQMLADAKEQGIDLLICSAYRPYNRQKQNFDRSVQSYLSAGYNEDDAVDAVKRLIAVPGTSEHETGLAADIVTPSYQSLNAGYAATPAAKWLAENAPEYGFILRYPEDKTEVTKIEFEPWHYRYVGREAALEITEQGLCLEEYLA